MGWLLELRPIGLFSLYLVLMFVLSTWLRVRQYRAVLSLVFTLLATVTLLAAIALLTAVREEMKARQDQMRAARIRRCTVSAAAPLELVQIDELAMLTAYGERTLVREALRLLAEILTQGRACLAPAQIIPGSYQPTYTYGTCK